MVGIKLGGFEDFLKINNKGGREVDGSIFS